MVCTLRRYTKTKFLFVLLLNCQATSCNLFIMAVSGMTKFPSQIVTCFWKIKPFSGQSRKLSYIIAHHNVAGEIHCFFKHVNHKPIYSNAIII